MQVYTRARQPQLGPHGRRDHAHGRATRRVRADPQDRAASRHDHRTAQRQGDGRVPARRRHHRHRHAAHRRRLRHDHVVARRRARLARRAPEERPRLVDDAATSNSPPRSSSATSRPRRAVGARSRRTARWKGFEFAGGRPHVPLLRDVQPRPGVVPGPRRDRARPVPEPARRVRSRGAPLHRVEPRPARLQAHAARGAAAHARLPHRPLGQGAVRVDRHHQRVQAPAGDVHARAARRSTARRGDGRLAGAARRRARAREPAGRAQSDGPWRS